MVFGHVRQTKCNKTFIFIKGYIASNGERNVYAQHENYYIVEKIMSNIYIVLRHIPSILVWDRIHE